ncbi:MAG: T9SS type A sorting domain-containing protein, partial [Dysgonamonadaceae bacterium]|nr:T9SS type A sorting domain-containing protein [Dysgonamonadaceae bacterium]
SNTEELQTVISEAQALYDSEAAGASELQAAIEKAQGFLAGESPADVLNAIDELKAAIRTYKYANASPSHPLDVTDFIVNPSFESAFTGWENLGFATQTNTIFSVKSGNTYIEKWVNIGSRVSDASVQQTLTGIPNGKYTLTAGTINVQQSAQGSTANNSTTPQTGAFLFAGLRNAAADTLKNRSIDFIVIDNQVTLGFKVESATGNWVACDNFRLAYWGQYDTDDYAAYLNDMVLNAQKLLTQKMQNSARQTLETAIAQAQQAATASPPVSEDISAARQLLETAVETVNLSIQAYVGLQAAIDYAGQVLEWYAAEPAKTEPLQLAVNTANVSAGNFDLTTEEINQAVAVLKTATQSVDKRIHIPTWMMGDVNNPANSWCYERSKQSKNWILFWEPGHGDKATSEMDACLALAEKSFGFYADSLKFITKGSSKTDTYKMVIRYRYTSDWEASGSGVDDRIGLLTLTPSAMSSRGGQTVAHEVGHCFQYQVHCDNNDQNGWMYGYGADASGGNGWWEQCAQWQAYKIFPSQQFTNEWFAGYLSHVNKHLLHESPRYENYFIQDYWCSLHGMDFIGRLWNESKKPEDPVDTYKRITGITQSLFNDEMYDCAAKFATWDIPHLKSYGSSVITSRPQPKMNNAGNNYWMIDSTVCVENYGHNIIRLNVPVAGEKVFAYFEGKAGMNGFRRNNTTNAGWRYGFVALKNDGTRIYSEMKTASMTDNEGKGTLSFDCPANCQRLWLVVSGAPKTHWKHAWDDNDANDEQWPYQVRFGNTNLSGYANVQPAGVFAPSEAIVHIYSESNTLVIDNLPFNAFVRIHNLLGNCLLDKKASGSMFTTALPLGMYIVNVQLATGRVINRKIVIKQ